MRKPIRSNVTGEKINEAMLQLLSDEWDVDEALVVITEELKEIVYNYFERRDEKLLRYIRKYR